MTFFFNLVFRINSNELSKRKEIDVKSKFIESKIKACFLISRLISLFLFRRPEVGLLIFILLTNIICLEIV